MNFDSASSWIVPVVIISFFVYRFWRNKKMQPLIQQYLNQNALVVDVRSPEEFKSGHYPKSINIPLQVIEARINELDSKRPIILCCASGGRSGMALGILKSKGFTEVINAGPWTNVKV